MITLKRYHPDDEERIVQMLQDELGKLELKTSVRVEYQKREEFGHVTEPSSASETAHQPPD